MELYACQPWIQTAIDVGIFGLSPNKLPSFLKLATVTAALLFGCGVRCASLRFCGMKPMTRPVMSLFATTLVLAGLLLTAVAAKPPHPTPTPSPTASPTPTPPSSTGSSFAVAYSATVAESVSQASSGSFVVGAFCDGPNCNGPATVLRVDSSGNIQSQTQYSYGTVLQSTALNIIKATSDGGAIYAGQPQFGCPAQSLNACGQS